MDRSISYLLQKNLSVLLIVIAAFMCSCNRLNKVKDEREAEAAKKQAEATRTKNLIKKIQGIHFTEVRRAFDNGISFSPVGYQLIPEWRISFPSLDSVTIYSPKKHRFLNAPVVFDHDSIFNVAWAWLKLRYIKKDSMQFMVLHVDGRVIIEEKTHVFMTFYTNDYIKNVLHSDTGKLWKPNNKDSAYIKAKALQANTIRDSAFAGTEPPVMKAKSPLISVKKEITPADDVNGGQLYDNYLSPTYDLVIHHAYTDFSYSYTAFVDQNGVITFRKSQIPLSAEFAESWTAAMKGITDGYLKLYLKVTPAKTLGIAHNSIIFLNAVGYKNK